jgi:hypothetical protein
LVIAAPKVVKFDTTTIALEPEYYRNLGAQRKLIRYGPFDVPGTVSGLNTTQLNTDMFWIDNFTMPCTNCYITMMQASLSHPDGTYANTESGFYLHHVVIINPGYKDAVCTTQSDRYFAAGNERTRLSLTAQGLVSCGSGPSICKKHN